MSTGEALELPLFPLQTVLFPGGRLPLRIFEQRYMEMAKACLRDGTPFGVCLIREGGEVGEPAVPEDLGCTARIVEWDMPQLGLLQVMARGEQRFRIRSRRVQADGLVLAGIELLPAETDALLDTQADLCARVLRRIVDAAPAGLVERSEERRVGKECKSQCRSRWTGRSRDRKSTRLNSSHKSQSRMPSSA